MKNTTTRLIVSNILVLIIICLVYLLSFNQNVEAALTNVYSKAEFKGSSDVKNSVGVMAIIDNDIDDIELIEKIAIGNNSNLSYMISPNLIIQNDNVIKDLLSSNYEIGIFGDSKEKLFKAIGILKSHNKNDILYIQRNQKTKEDMFSNQIRVVVYSIDANIAYQNFSSDFGSYIEEGAFIIFNHEGEVTTDSIFKAINKTGLKIRSVGEMMQ